MSNSLRRGDLDIAAGVPLAKGLWMLGASGAVAALTVAGTLVVSPGEPAVSPSNQALPSYAPSRAQRPGPPVLDDVPLAPRPQPSAPDQAAAPDMVSAGEVLPPVALAEVRAEGRGVVGERPLSVIAPQVQKVVAQQVQHVQVVVEAVHPAQVVPEVVHRVQAVVQPVRPQWSGWQFVQPAQRPQVAPQFIPQFPTSGTQPTYSASQGFNWFGGSC